MKRRIVKQRTMKQTRIPCSVRTTSIALALSVLAIACTSNADATGDSPTGTPGVEVAADTPLSADGAAAADLGGSADLGALDLSVGPLPEELAPLADGFSKYVDVWGVNIVATANTDDAKVLHAANVMAQYLDNDADGAPDDPAVVAAMVTNRATLLMGQTPDEFESLDVDSVFNFVGQGGQDLYGQETKPDRGFDASLEEVHHLILNTGWSQLHPELLAQTKGSALAEAMDIARGGQFDSIPNPYPDGAWYTYDDQTCDYTCMLTEYAYWAHTSLLGAQEGRADEIGQEWRLETADEVRSNDPAVAAIFEDPTLGLPTVIPDGNYTG